MACKNCKDVNIETCSNTYCGGEVSTPCKIKLADRCVTITSALPNIGNCKSEAGDFECQSLNTVLLAIDSLLSDCGDDTFVNGMNFNSTTNVLTITLNDGTSYTVDLDSLSIGSVTFDNTTNILSINLEDGTSATVDLSDLANSPISVEEEGVTVNTAPITVIDFVGSGVTATETAPGEIQVSVPQDQFDVEEEGAVVNTAPITSIDFVGSGVTATETAAGEIQVEVDGTPDTYNLMSSTAYFAAVRTSGTTYSVSPPIGVAGTPGSGVCRLGGIAKPTVSVLGGVATSCLYPDATNWESAVADINFASPALVTKDDQYTLAIPIPVDLSVGDQIVPTARAWMLQASGSPKISTFIGSGACDADLDITTLDATAHALSTVVTGRNGNFQQACIRVTHTLASNLSSTNNHLFVGFGWQGWNLTEDPEPYTEEASVNWNLSVVKNS